MQEFLPDRDNRIFIRGARVHNLKNVDLTLPTEALIVVTGVSGSGKSTLAFDTIYAEGQRRYVESLSAYARQFLERMEKPDVERIDGICPAIAIRQKGSLRNPRSTVATTTEIHDYVRLLYARVGRTICRNCRSEIVRETAEVAAKMLARLSAGTRLLVGFDMPVVATSPNLSKTRGDIEGEEELPEASKTSLNEPTGDVSGFVGTDSDRIAVETVIATIDTLRRKGFGRIMVDGQATGFDEIDPAMLTDVSTLKVVVDRVKVGPDMLGRLTDSIETAYSEGGGAAFAAEIIESTEVNQLGHDEPTTSNKRLRSSNHRAVQNSSGQIHLFSERFECRPCGIQYEVPQPRLFSFNSPFGACQTCHGFGNIVELDMDQVVPDRTKSIQQNAIEPWSRPRYRPKLAILKRVARASRIRLDVPWLELTEEEKLFIIEGDGLNYEGINGFFKGLERKKYKVHIRVFLSRYRGYFTCPSCGGTRLRREARDVVICGRSIDSVCGLTVREAKTFFEYLELTERESFISDKIVKEIRKRLLYLDEVGLDYLTLDRLSSSLSGGESQRIKLAASLGSGLVGTLYVLDEPSIGLHPRDNRRLMKILCQLRDQGNTVLVVEHDAEMIRNADYVVDLGLGAGDQGGRVVYEGSFEGLLEEQKSLTSKYLRGELVVPIPATRRKHTAQSIRLFGATQHNLKNVDVVIPLNTLTCVTGVSGSGKSTLVHDVLYAAIKRTKGDWNKRVGAHEKLEGLEFIGNAVLVDQTPIGRSPRSNPVTYLKAFDSIRQLLASTKDGRSRGLTAGHFSFNVPGGRCDTCEGEGVIRVEMQFLADVFVPCDQCNGKRFKPQVLEVRYRGRSIDQVLDMTIREAISFFGNSQKIVRRLKILDEVGLGYLRLGQPATTLSGGEAQRIKIASHLSARSDERTLYILDEPTTGLHFDDIAKLLASFRKLLESGHSLLVIEHNLDVLKTADWIVDLGPEGGNDGGRIVATGTPEQVALEKGSHTGRFLRNVLTAEH